MKIQKKEMRGLKVQNFYADGNPQPDALNKLADSYSEHIWVYACVKAIAVNIASLPLQAFRANADGQWEVYDKNPLEILLRNPNPYYSWRDMEAFTSISLDLTGNAYWGFEKNNKGQIFEVYPLPSGDVKTVSTKDKLIDHYIYTVNNKPIRYELDELIHFREPNPNDQTYGLGSVTPAKLSVLTDFYAQTYNKMFFKNNARPDAILQTDQPLDDATAKRVLASWKAANEGSEKRGKTALLSNGVKYEEVNRTPKDIDFLEGRKQNREEILAAFGVPPVIVGIFEYANYANSKEQIQIFWKHTLLPRKDLIEQTLTRWSQKYLKDALTVLELDCDNVEALRVDEAQRATTAKLYVDMGVPINMVIDALELPFDPIDGGDVPRVVPAPINVAPSGNNPPAKSIGKKEAPVSLWQKNMLKDMLWKSFNDQVSSHETATKSAMRLFFKSQGRRVAKAWDAHGAKIIQPFIGKKSKELPTISIDMIWKDADEEIKMKGPSTRTIRGTYYDFAISTSRKVKPDFDFSLSDPAAQYWIENKVMKLTQQATRTTKEAITDAIVEGIKDAVVQGFDLGESVDAIADRIDEVFQFANDYRSETIARTETASAANAGSQEGMKAAGAEQKEWLATRDDKTRDSHAALDGEVVGIDDDFVSESGAKLEFPGDPTAPPEEIINCRCALLPVVSEE